MTIATLSDSEFEAELSCNVKSQQTNLAEVEI